MDPKCKSCPFNTQQKVYGEGTITEGSKLLAVKGDRYWDVVVVGMAPAREELEQGRPFVGVSGQILRRTLFQMDIGEYYVTNTLLCEITDDSSVPAAVECCRERLLEEVSSKKPKLVIALGDLPLHVLADTEYKIKEVEGRVIPSKVGPLLPVTHPAYYWRHPDEFFDFIECSRSGIKFLKGEYMQAEEPEVTVVTSENLSSVKCELDRYEELAVDLETTGFFAYGWEPNEVLEMGLAPNHKQAFIVPKEMIGEFKELLEDKKMIFWNAQFDSAFLKVLGVSPNVYFDGMLAHYTIDERPYSHGLKRVARIYLGSDDWEKDVDKYLPSKKKKDISYEVIPKEVRYTYLAKDVTRTYQLKEALLPEVNSRVLWDILMPACRMFIEIEYRGMRINPVKLMDLGRILEEELSKLDDDLMDLADAWINPLSSKQVSEYLYVRLGLPVDPKLGFTTNKAYLANFRDQYPYIDKLLDYRELAKLKSTYVEGFARFVDRNFRIHPSIKLFGSVTGRLSSANPSIMNIKSTGRLKEIFLPDYNHVLLYSDVKQNELRWYCIIGRDEELKKVLLRGGDPHELVTSVAYGKDQAKKMRTLGKAVVFGRLYGRGRKDIERQVGRENIDLLIKTVDSVFPNIPNYNRWVAKELKTKGYLESYFGRKRRFPLITPDNRHEVERQAVNFPIQSAGTDLMLLTMLHLWEVKDKLEIWPFWPYHDSITMDAVSPKVLPLVKKEMEDYSLELVDGELPFLWDMDWGLDWSLNKEVGK
jgi:DNA polymerase-1